MEFPCATLKLMKTLKFTSELCDKILSGDKTTTWRHFDDKDLKEGDEIQLVAKETGVVIGTGTITKMSVKTLGSLDKSDWEGHETYTSTEEMYKTYEGYYGKVVGPDTELKIIHFSFVPSGK